jgi:hypothetical protein
MSRQAARLAGQLRQYGGQPAFWADDVRGYLAALRAEMPGPDFATPSDLGGGSGEASRRLFQRLVLRLGGLLQAWPDVVEAARALRARGVRLAVPVGG